jgi:hypothetical protein
MDVESDASVTPNNFTFSPTANLDVDIPLTLNLLIQLIQYQNKLLDHYLYHNYEVLMNLVIPHQELE